MCGAPRNKWKNWLKIFLQACILGGLIAFWKYAGDVTQILIDNGDHLLMWVSLGMYIIAWVGEVAFTLMGRLHASGTAGSFTLFSWWNTEGGRGLDVDALHYSGLLLQLIALTELKLNIFDDKGHLDLHELDRADTVRSIIYISIVLIEVLITSACTLTDDERKAQEQQLDYQQVATNDDTLQGDAGVPGEVGNDTLAKKYVL